MEQDVQNARESKKQQDIDNAQNGQNEKEAELVIENEHPEDTWTAEHPQSAAGTPQVQPAQQEDIIESSAYTLANSLPAEDGTEAVPIYVSAIADADTDTIVDADKVDTNGQQNDSTTSIEKEPKSSPQTDGSNPRILKKALYAVGILAISVFLAVSFLYCFTDSIGLFRPDKTVRVTIPRGASSGQITSILKSDGVIRSPFAFNLYIAVAKRTGMRSGTYDLDAQLDYARIIKKLQTGPNTLRAVTVTIPEGYTLVKMGELLEKNKVCKETDFLKAADSADTSFDFQSAIPNDPNRLYRLEGYLFPDTYQFYQHQAAASVVKKMLQNFDRRFTPALRSEAKRVGMSVDQAVILASIIQKEAGGGPEIRKVSSVFHNRLKYGVYGKKLLQSDATVRYVRYVVELSASAKQGQITAYNTYKHEGLPPGAICNPGISAIKAALNPENTNDYYFVSDSAGRYYYAHTFKKHKLNVARARRVGAASGTNVTK